MPALGNPWLVRTQRLLLRVLSEEDRREFVRMHEVSADLHRPWVPLMTPGQTFDDLFRTNLAKAIQGQQDGGECRLVAYLAEGRMAALVNLVRITRGVFHCAYAGWAVNAEIAGHGYCTEAVAGALDYAFAPPPLGLALHRIQANIIPHNRASVRVAEKNGFRVEGLGLKYLQIAGQWQDHRFYAKLTDEHALRYLKTASAAHPPAAGASA